MSIFAAFAAAFFSVFGQFEHLKMILIIEQTIWGILKWLQNFSYGHDKYRTGFISTQSLIKTSHVSGA